jgi:hypothetical protein
MYVTISQKSAKLFGKDRQTINIIQKKNDCSFWIVDFILERFHAKWVSKEVAYHVCKKVNKKETFL